MRVEQRVEKVFIMKALERCNGNKLHAAKLLGITRATLRKRVEKFGIRRAVSIH